MTAGYTLWLAGDDFHTSVKGIVTNAVTGERLRKAYVRLGNALPAAVTDENGRFAFENVPPGDYAIEAEHSGYIDSDAAVELKLAADQELSGIEIQLMPPAAISGHVRDQDGDLWTHANISVYRSAWRRGKRQLEGFDGAEVDDKGEFRVGHLPPGRYYLSAKPDARWETRNRAASVPQLQITLYPGSLDSAAAAPVTVLPGQELTGMEIQLRRAGVYRIRGRVSGLQEIPLLPGPVQWMKPRLSVTSALGADSGTRMKEDGSFEVEGIAPGNYEIHVSEGIWPSITLGAATVRIVDHDVEGVSFAVHAPHLLKGIVRTQGNDKVVPSGLSLLVETQDGPGWEGTVAPEKDGSFDFKDVPWGHYRVQVRGALAGQYYVKRLRYGATESAEAEFSTAGSDDSLELILSARGPRVSGVVPRNGTGESPTTPQVVLLPDTAGHDTYAGVLDQSGEFTVKNAVRPGEYTLYAFEGVPDGVWTDAEFIKAIDGKGVRIKVEEGDAKTVEVPLIPRAEIGPLLARLGIN